MGKRAQVAPMTTGNGLPLPMPPSFQRLPFSGGEDAVVARMVFEDADLVPVAAAFGEVAGGGALVELDFEKDAAARVQARGGFGEDPAVEVQAVGAAVEGPDRFVLADAAVERCDL